MKRFAWLSLLAFPLSSFAFSDITINDPAYDSTTYLERIGVFSGYEDGTFGRDKTINRAEALKTILMAAEMEVPEEASEQKFEDVPADIWFARYVNFSADQGIVKGDDTTGLFAPGRDVNKAEFLKMMMHAFEIDPTQYPVIDEVQLNDVPDDIWFAPYFKFAAKFSILLPDGEGKVMPGEMLSRAGASELLFSMIRQGKGLKPQELLNLSEVHLLRSVEFMESDAVTTSSILVNIAGLYTQYALELLPDNNIVQSADKVVDAMRSINQTYAEGAAGNLDEVIRLAQDAWAKAEESRALNDQNIVLTDKIKEIAEGLAAKARAQQAQTP